jgi:preprotein translocase subunit SecE
MSKYIDTSMRYIKEVRVEMAKVVWPTWIELRGSTILVIILSVFFAAYVGIIDLFLSFIWRIF